MEEAIRFLTNYEIWVYALLGIVGLFYVRKFIIAWQELRGAVFGLEQDNAQVRLNQSASLLLMVFIMAMGEFVIVTFVAPAVPASNPLMTPTVDLLATSTTTLLPITPAVGDQTTITPTLVLQEIESGCIAGQISIDAPENEVEISGVVEIHGTVNVANFGFYKLEMRPSGEENWLTILAGNEIVTDGILGTWNTSLLTPGNYELGLIVTDNQGQSFQACIIKTRVVGSGEDQ